MAGLVTALVLLVGVPLIVVAMHLREEPAGMILRKPPAPGLSTLLHPDLEAGIAAAEGGRLEDAARRFARVPPGHPSRALALQNLAAVRERLGQPAEAERLWVEAINLRPEDPRPYVAVARLRHGEGRDEQAELWALRAVEVAPEDAAARFAVALYRLSAGRTTEAVETLSRAVALDPSGRGLPEIERELRRLSETRPEGFYALAYLASLTGDRTAERYSLERFLATEPAGPLADAAAARLAALTRGRAGAVP
jgi:tetratricopeptide (TPR) repeat protein